MVNELPRKRKLLLAAMATTLAVLITFGLAEVLIRLVDPQPSLYPRFEFSRRYGFELYQNAQMIHTMPGQWRFIYTTNEYRYRGEPVPVSNAYQDENIVALGDSYTFGQGVNDAQVYTAIMRSILKPEFNVVNLGVGGLGTDPAHTKVL